MCQRLHTMHSSECCLDTFPASRSTYHLQLHTTAFRTHNVYSNWNLSAIQTAAAALSAWMYLNFRLSATNQIQGDIANMIAHWCQPEGQNPHTPIVCIILNNLFDDDDVIRIDQLEHLLACSDSHWILPLVVSRRLCNWIESIEFVVWIWLSTGVKIEIEWVRQVFYYVVCSHSIALLCRKNKFSIAMAMV